MQGLVRRPPFEIRPGNSLWAAEHFQIAYVSTDLEQAADLFSARFGIKAFAGLDSVTPEGGSIRIKLAWVGGIMIELMQASGAGTAFLTEKLPPQGFAVRHHHFGYMVDSIESWESLMSTVQREQRTIPMQAHVDGFLRFCWVEAQELDHYLEYFLLEAGGVAFFESIPAT